MQSIDTYLISIGGFGRYQMFLTSLLMLLPIEAAMNILSLIFTAYSPPYTCSKCIANTSCLNTSLHMTDECDIPKILEVCTKWDYDGSVVLDTIVTQFDLICDRKWYVATAKTVSMAGLMFGVLSCAVADKIGRKKVLLISLMIVAFGGIGSAFSDNFILFLFFRFLISAFSICLHTTAFILAIELLPSYYTIHIGYLKMMFWGIGTMILTGIAYISRKRKYIEFAIAGYGIVTMLIAFVLPESPKWLYSQNKIESADLILHKIAKKNGYSFEKKAGENLYVKAPPKESYIQIFSNWRLSIIAVILYFGWFSVSLVYYGLTFLVGTLSGNLYVNNVINGFVEIPCAIAVIATSKCFGRRMCAIISFLFTGILLLLTQVIPSNLNILTTVIGMIGKGTSSFAFSILYLYTGEFYPTSIRASGLAISSMFARIGGAVAPYILEIDSSNMICFITFGCLSLISGILIALLPETKGKVMPQLIEDCNTHLPFSIDLISMNCEERSL